MPRPASTSARRDDHPYYDTKHPSASPPSAINPNPPRPLAPTTVQSTLLQPRVAVALGLSAKWHPFLFACRLLSCLPAAWWGLPVALGLLAQAHVWYIVESGMSSCGEESLRLAGLSWLRGRAVGADIAVVDDGMVFERRLRVTEMGLGIVWVCYFFPDLRVGRWDYGGV